MKTGMKTPLSRASLTSWICLITILRQPACSPRPLTFHFVKKMPLNPLYTLAFLGRALLPGVPGLLKEVQIASSLLAGERLPQAKADIATRARTAACRIMSTSPTAGLSLAAKSDLIKQQLGLPGGTSIPDAVAAATQILGLENLDSMALAQKVEACCTALFGASISPVDVGDKEQQSQPLEDKPADASQPPLPVVLAAEPSPVATLRAVRPLTADVSAAHHVTNREELRVYLTTLGLGRMLAELVADESAAATTKENSRKMQAKENSVESAAHCGEHSTEARWFAEHARAQLSPNSGCESRPAWVARVAVEAAGGLSSDSGDGGLAGASELQRVTVSLWASEGKAARRALLALQLERTGLSVHLCTYDDAAASAGGSGAVSSRNGHAAQVRQWAYEREGYELCDEVEGGSAHIGAVYSSVLRAATDGADKARLRESRMSAAEADGQLAWGKIESLSQRLLLLDPMATMNIAPGVRPGSYVLNQLTFKGHSMEFAADIDKHSSLEALEQLATVSCMCCSGGDSPLDSTLAAM